MLWVLAQLNSVLSPEEMRAATAGKLIVFPVKASSKSFKDAANALTDKLEATIFQAGRWEIVTRQDLETLIEEKKMSLMGLTDEELLSKTGEFIPAARYGLMVKLTSIAYKSAELEKTVKRKEKFGEVLEIREKIKGYKARISAIIKLYDIKETKPIWIKEKRVTGSPKETKQEALDSALSLLASDTLYLLRKAFPIEAIVKEIEGSKVYLAHFYRKNPFIKHLLLTPKEGVGLFEVVSVDENGAWAKIKFFTRLEEGMKLKEFVVRGYEISVGPLFYYALLNKNQGSEDLSEETLLKGLYISGKIFPTYMVGGASSYAPFGLGEFLKEYEDSPVFEIIRNLNGYLALNLYLTNDVFYGKKTYYLFGIPASHVRIIRGIADLSAGINLIDLGAIALPLELGIGVDMIRLEVDYEEWLEEAAPDIFVDFSANYYKYGIAAGISCKLTLSQRISVNLPLKLFYCLAEPEKIKVTEEKELTLGEHRLSWGVTVGYFF